MYPKTSHSVLALAYYNNYGVTSFVKEVVISLFIDEIEKKKVFPPMTGFYVIGIVIFPETSHE